MPDEPDWENPCGGMALGRLVSHLGQPQSQDSSEPLEVTEAQDIYMTTGTVGPEIQTWPLSAA